MKKVEIKYLKYCNALIAVLLSLLGFTTSCFKPMTDYGVPPANYVIKGKIVLSVDSSVLSNIQVKIKADSVKSDINGNYTISKYGDVSSPIFTVQFRDVDGTANGEIAPLDTFVKFSGGEKLKELDVKLKPK
jgi:putative lipoprotein (rSAM/lipoprotein system)